MKISEYPPGGGGARVGVCKHNICNHVAVFVIPFYIQLDYFCKKLKFYLLTQGQGEGG